MAIVKCPNGHHYNTDDNKTCPHCEEKKSDSSFDWTVLDRGPSNFVGGWDNPTETIGSGPSNGPSRGSSNGWDGHTERITDSDIGVTLPHIGTGEDTDPTVPNWNRDEYKRQPVVGWLVCIEGPDKGKDFCLHGAKSSIGRKEGSSVCLSDPKISRNGFPAVIVYDDRKSHRFYLANGDASAQNNVELRGDMLLGQSVIEPYDEIRIEDTALVFVPFCGEDFYWKEA